MIVDLPVEGQYETTIRREHRLVTRRRQIDNSEASVAKTHSRVDAHPQPEIIGAAVGNRVGHPLQHVPVDPGRAYDASYPAHYVGL